MNEYAITQARSLMQNTKSLRDLTVYEAYVFMDELPTHRERAGVWAGSPEGEMASAYLSDKTLVCRYILSLVRPGWMDGGNDADLTGAELARIYVRGERTWE